MNLPEAINALKQGIKVKHKKECPGKDGDWISTTIELVPWGIDRNGSGQFVNVDHHVETWITSRVYGKVHCGGFTSHSILDLMDWNKNLDGWTS